MGLKRIIGHIKIPVAKRKERGGYTVIGGETVDIFHMLPEGRSVCLGYESGPHLTPGLSDLVQVFLGQEQVVRANLTCHLIEKTSRVT